MTRMLFFLSPLLSLFAAAGGYMSLDDAKEFATRYYSNIEKTIRTGKEPTSKEEYIKMFGCDSKGNPIYTADNNYPNHLFLIDKNGEWEQRDYPETIFGDMAEFKHEHSDATFNYKCGAFNYCRPPELRKNEDDPTFARILFRTEWTVNGRKTVIDDTVYVNLKDGYISRICNKIVPLANSAEETLEDMMAKAAGLYNNKNYDAAAALYGKVLKKYPNNDDAWSYLGVMYFKGQGVGKLSKKQRLQNAYDCWKKSDLKKACRAIAYITDGREGC